MKKLSWLLVLAGVMSVPAIAADSPHSVSYNVGLTTDYIFRGVSQSQGDPAISGGIDYSHASGFYAGAWASTQKWVETGPTKTDSDFELDIYGGYKGAVGDIGYDVGLIRYSYDGDRGAAVTLPSPDTTEAYIGVSWKFLSAKYSYTISDYFVGWGTLGTTQTEGSGYLELNATHDLGDGWGLLGHIGHQEIENVGIASYTDFKVGVTKDVGFGVVTLTYSDTDADTASYTWGGEKVADGAFALSFSKSF